MTVSALKAAADGIADSQARELFKTALDSLYEENQKVIAANLAQPLADAAPGLVYDHANQRLLFTGTLSAMTVEALKATAEGTMADSDARALFRSAMDHLYEENKKVIRANLEQEIVDAASGRLVYDYIRKRLSYAGVLTSEMRPRLPRRERASSRPSLRRYSKE